MINLAEPERAAALSGDRDIRVGLHTLRQRAGGTCAHAKGASTGSQASARRGRYEHQAERRAIFAADQLPLEKRNNFRCPLIWGHPQALMGTRGGDRADRGIGTAGRLRLVHRLRRR